MYSTYLALALAVLFMDAALLVHAGLFIVQPSKGSTCTAGQPCTVSWIDDGTRPLLSAIGVSNVGLYTGKQQLVQSITPVDVTTAHSVTFTPNSAAGPNSDSYYIALISTTLAGNGSLPYSAYSPFFQLTGMSGSFDSPLPAATSPIPIPASLSQTSSGTTATPATITVGTLSTAPLNTLPTARPSSSSSSSSARPSSSSTSKLLTSITPSASASPTTSVSPTSVSPTTSVSPSQATSSTSAASTSDAIGGASKLPALLSMLALAVSLAIFS